MTSQKKTSQHSKEKISRRRFIGQAGAAAFGASSLAAMQLNLDAVQAAAMANPDATGYKALVCILLAGGNDSFNMLVPNADHGAYVVARGGLHSSGRGGVALPTSSLTAIGDGRFAAHNSLQNMASLYDGGDLAFLANAGPLVQPLIQGTTRPSLSTASTPRGLFSHSDQINAWQVVGGSGTGALGRLDDVYHDPSATGLAAIGGNISVAGTNVMQRGVKSRHYTLSSQGPVRFTNSGVDSTRATREVNMAVGTQPGGSTQNLYNSSYGGAFKQAYAQHMTNAVANATSFSSSYDSTRSASRIPNGLFDSKNKAAAQLEVVARSIEMQKNLRSQDQAARQVFFVLLGGWDDHSNLISAHGPRLKALNDAMFQFSDGLKRIGKWDEVVTFTVSDFGRTLRSNGSGTDHGWGGNHMIMGGAVKGRNIYGTYPDRNALQPGSYLDSDAAQGRSNGAGRLIPTTSADEYVAELAQWFGVPPSRLSEVVPNIGKFYTPRDTTTPLGFMN